MSRAWGTISTGEKEMVTLMPSDNKNDIITFHVLE